MAEPLGKYRKLLWTAFKPKASCLLIHSQTVNIFTLSSHKVLLMTTHTHTQTLSSNPAVMVGGKPAKKVETGALFWQPGRERDFNYS